MIPSKQNMRIELSWEFFMVHVIRNCLINSRHYDLWKGRTIEQNSPKNFSFVMWFFVVWSINDTCFNEKTIRWTIHWWESFIRTMIINSSSNYWYFFWQVNHIRRRFWFQSFISKMIFEEKYSFKRFSLTNKPIDGYEYFSNHSWKIFPFDLMSLDSDSLRWKKDIWTRLWLDWFIFDRFIQLVDQISIWTCVRKE